MRLISIITISLLFSCISPAVAAEGSLENERFQVVDESIVLDSHSGLMWASQDNGKDIDYYEAETYCKDFNGGGYTDWRLPDLKELATLYADGKKNKDGYFVTDLIKVTDCCIWSADISMGGSSSFSFKTGRKPFNYMRDSYQLRVLPVRSTKKMESHK